jgi:dTDP-4-amino-4,6-dideoxygalactose transaminase
MSYLKPMWKARLSELGFDERELSAVLDALDSEWITAGPRTEAFEKAFAKMTGTADAVAVANGTAALFLSMKALGIGAGDEVLVPSLTFVATAAAVVHCGATPVLVDINTLDNPTMCAQDAARKVTSRTKAILPVHYAGIPADMGRLCELARSYRLHLIEDAAHAPGARFHGSPCGSFGVAGCFSFFGNKNITTGEGGMITTNDPDLARRLRLLRSHGMTVSSWDRDKGRAAQYDVIEFGYNFRFDDVRAALGLAQLQKLEVFNRQRAAMVRRYNLNLTEPALGLILPYSSIVESKLPSFHIYPIGLESREKRDALADRLRANGIQTSIHYPPIHHFSAFKKTGERVNLPFTEAYAARELTLPLYPSLSTKQVDLIAGTVVNFITDLTASF